jgi:hypothetical protein
MFQCNHHHQEVHYMSLLQLQLKKKQSIFLLQFQRPSFIPIQNMRQNYSSVYFSFCIFLIAKWKTKDSPQHDTVHS